MVFDLAKFTYDSKNSNRFISGMNDQSSIQSRFLTQDIYLDDNDVLLASPTFDITQHFNQVTTLLSGYDALRQVYHAKMRVYKGDHEAIKRMQLGNSLVKQDSKVMANLGKNIVNTFVGTFASIPVKITYMNPDDNKSNSDDLNKEIQQILSTSNSSDVFFEWAKKADIYGRGYSVAYVKQDKDKNKHTKFSQMSPENCLVVYDNTLDHNKLFAITFQLIDGMYYGHLYTDEQIYKFSNSVSGLSTDNSTRFSKPSGQDNDNGLADTNWNGDPNPFGIVPVSELPENEERSGLLDDIAPLMDQLDETFTAQHSDVMYFSNALLIVKGKELSDEDRRTIRKWHVAQLNADRPEDLQNVSMEYLDKPQNDQQQEHHIQHLKNEIYETSQVINLSDPQLGNSASGDALDKKLQPMVMLAGSKGRKMEAAIKDLLRILFTQSQLIKNENIENIIAHIQVKFTVNIPHNLLDITNAMKNVHGDVSQKLFLSMYPYLDNIQDELDEEAQERQQNVVQFANAKPDNTPNNNNNDENNDDSGNDTSDGSTAGSGK